MVYCKYPDVLILARFAEIVQPVVEGSSNIFSPGDLPVFDASIARGHKNRLNRKRLDSRKLSSTKQHVGAPSTTVRKGKVLVSCGEPSRTSRNQTLVQVGG